MRRIKSTCAEIVLHRQDKVFMLSVKATCAEIVLHDQDTDVAKIIRANGMFTRF